uniref:Uncharacterized protein n=1 Tax=Anguilla anguilla TaxID=7936 RepID=A0A0E9Q4B7_ANGAN
MHVFSKKAFVLVSVWKHYC